jgi:hypothetical protein
MSCSDLQDFGAFYNHSSMSEILRMSTVLDDHLGTLLCYLQAQLGIRLLQSKGITTEAHIIGPVRLSIVVAQ